MPGAPVLREFMMYQMIVIYMLKIFLGLMLKFQTYISTVFLIARSRMFQFVAAKAQGRPHVCDGGASLGETLSRAQFGAPALREE